MSYLDPNAGKLREGKAGAAVANLAASTNLSAVPGAFVDAAAVQTYLAVLVPQIETRLDTIEAKLNGLLGALREAGLVQA